MTVDDIIKDLVSTNNRKMPRTVVDTGITKYITTALYNIFIVQVIYIFSFQMHCKYVWYFLPI